MRLRQCEYFEAILKYGSIRAASKELRISEPTISVQIRSLEKELGVTLFSRESRQLTLTPEGEALAPALRQVMVASRAVHRSASEIRRPTGVLRVGIVPSHARRLVGQLMELVRDSYPQLLLDVIEGGSLSLEEDILAGQIDVALVVRADGVGRTNMHLAAIRLMSGSLVALMSPQHRLSRSGGVRMRDLLGEPLLLYRSGYLVRELVIHILGNQIASPVMYSSDNSEATRHLVRRGLGISFASDFDLLDTDDVEREPLAKVQILDAPRLEFCCAYLRGRHIPGVIAKAIATHLFA